MSKRAHHNVKGVSQAPVAQAMRIRTRLACSPTDTTVLAALGEHFCVLQGQDLAERCRAGLGNDKQAWATRKQALTAHCSSRWAGWVTKTSNDAWDAAKFCPGRQGKVYLDASFTPAASPEVPKLSDLLAGPDLRILAVDLNHGFLAPAVLDSSGNPIALLPDVPLVTEDLPASTRDGHLRAAITQLLDLAEAHGCRLIVAEDLGFPEMRATGRERYGSRKWSRKVVCGLPTRQFRHRLVAMASRRGMAVAGVPAAYSSIWGSEHWQGPTHRQVQV
jgi:hypothetical protein